MKANVVANYCGQAWRILMQLAFVPLYIRFLGIEAYGLIGIFALLMGSLVLLDVGMKPALFREMARFTAGAHNAQSIRDLLRSIEIIVVLIAAGVALGIWAASGWLASDWLRLERLPAPAVAHAISIMGLVIGLSFVEDIYVNSISGLQRQVLQNALTSAVATVRAVGAVGVLAWISPTVEAFFFWQGLISLITVALFAATLHRILPSGQRPARFSWAAILGIWHFAAGMLAIVFLSILLTQIDKILLSRLLTLEAFAYYALAGVVANALANLETPITASFYPRFTELVTRDNRAILSALYHQGSQLVTVMVGAAASVLIVFCVPVLMLWTGNPVLVQHVAPLVTVLAFGALLHSLMGIPGSLALAYGWTLFPIYVNIVAVCVIVPAIFWLVPIYGAIAAAWAWVALNSGYVLFAIALLHRRLLTTEKWSWYIKDTLMPLASAFITALLCHKLAPDNLGKLGEFSVLLVTSGLVLIAAALSAPLVRHQLIAHILPLVSSRRPGAI
jgi:O-antigen/teichoic acid export membrane protein